MPTAGPSSALDYDVDRRVDEAIQTFLVHGVSQIGPGGYFFFVVTKYKLNFLLVYHHILTVTHTPPPLSSIVLSRTIERWFDPKLL